MEFIVGLAIFVAIVVVAVAFLKGFDQVAGRGPTQVSRGIERARDSDDRIPCPMCAELILPQAKICRFCKSKLE